MQCVNRGNSAIRFRLRKMNRQDQQQQKDDEKERNKKNSTWHGTTQ